MSPRNDLRPNEETVDLPPPGDAQLRFIGVIRTPFTSRELCPRQGDAINGPECRVVLEPLWHRALKGLERYEFIELFYWLHESRRDLVLQSPKANGETTGTFALRSPVRPNPIGLSRVRLLGVEAGALRVRGLDCLNGTPLLDVKPDRCAYTPQVPPKPTAMG